MVEADDGLELAADPFRMFSLEGRIALVTGASRGLGRATALLFAGAGASLVLAARSAEGLEETAADVRRLGRQAQVVPGDVTDPAHAAELVGAATEAFGRIDVLVNNAGGSRFQPSVELSIEEWDQVLRLNLTSAFGLSRAVAPGMLAAGRGCIVNIGSLSGRRGHRGMAHYAAAKAGLANLTRSLAAEWAPAIRVNVIAAGTVATAKNLARFTSDRQRERWARRPLLQRLGEPRDVACAALYLASDAAAWMTGQTLELNGGEWLPA